MVAEAMVLGMYRLRLEAFDSLLDIGELDEYGSREERLPSEPCLECLKRTTRSRTKHWPSSGKF
jgi:hypothetical protein